MNWLEVASKLVEQNSENIKFAPLSNIAGADIKFNKGYCPLYKHSNPTWCLAMNIKALLDQSDATDTNVGNK